MSRPEPLASQSENSLNPINWEKLFEPDIPSRELVDPRHELQEASLARQLTAYLEKQGRQTRLPFRLTPEWADLLDEGVREVCLVLNELPFAKTVSSCAGHAVDRRTSLEKEKAREERLQKEGIETWYFPFYFMGNTIKYGQPDINIMYDPRDPRSQAMQDVIRSTAQIFEDRYPNFSLHMFDYSDPSEPVKTIKIQLLLAVPEEWCRKQNKPTVSELLSRHDEIAPQKADAKFLDDLPEGPLHDEFIANYADYFDSPEARQIIAEFFQALAEEVKRQFLSQR